MVARPVFGTDFEAVWKPVYAKKLNPVSNKFWNLRKIKILFPKKRISTHSL